MYCDSIWPVCPQVKAAVLDPDNEFNVERTLTKEDVQKLIQVLYMYIMYLYMYVACIQKLLILLVYTTYAINYSIISSTVFLVIRTLF